MFFVERLEGMLANGKKLPLTSSVVVDQASALELIDELRHAIPEEVQSARRINAEGERILERANQEAERIVARAREQATQLIDEQGLTEAAEAVRKGEDFGQVAMRAMMVVASSSRSSRRTPSSSTSRDMM